MPLCPVLFLYLPSVYCVKMLRVAMSSICDLRFVSQCHCFILFYAHLPHSVLLPGLFFTIVMTDSKDCDPGSLYHHGVDHVFVIVYVCTVICRFSTVEIHWA